MQLKLLLHWWFWFPRVLLLLLQLLLLLECEEATESLLSPTLKAQADFEFTVIMAAVLESSN